MQLSGLTPEDIRANIQHAKAKADAALAEYEAAKAELAWWQQGLRLVDPKAAAAMEAQQEPEAIITDLFPDGLNFENGARPTLRQAMVVVMRENSQVPSWNITDLAYGLDAYGWLPERAETRDARKRVSDMAARMYEDGQLARVGRGVYKLSPPLAAALDAAGEAKE